LAHAELARELPKSFVVLLEEPKLLLVTRVDDLHQLLVRRLSQELLELFLDLLLLALLHLLLFLKLLELDGALFRASSCLAFLLGAWLGSIVIQSIVATQHWLLDVIDELVPEVEPLLHVLKRNLVALQVVLEVIIAWRRIIACLMHALLSNLLELLSEATTARLILIKGLRAVSHHLLTILSGLALSLSMERAISVLIIPQKARIVKIGTVEVVAAALLVVKIFAGVQAEALQAIFFPTVHLKMLLIDELLCLVHLVPHHPLHLFHVIMVFRHVLSNESVAALWLSCE